jgi:hypothetical protein
LNAIQVYVGGGEKPVLLAVTARNAR